MKSTLLVALLALLWVLPAAALDIVYPSDKSYFTRSNFLIIKGGDKPALDGMIIEFGGARSDLIDISSPEYRAAFADFLILQPEFDPGKNLIKVEGYVQGKKVAETTADVFYLNGDPSAIPPRGYKPFVMHLPEREALCAPCHNMNPDPAELNMESEQYNPCASCHRRMLNEAFVHGPAGVYQCAYCHQPESEPARYQVRPGDASLCNECHYAKVEEFNNNEFVHGPVGAGLCTVCHDAHATPHPAQVHVPINDLCLGCHEDVAKEPHVSRGITGQRHPIGGVPDPSSPGRMLTCASCHNPHGGMASSLFQRGITSRFGLCGMCHQK